MGFWTALVSDVKPELTDWLKTRGGTVSDLPLSLINRGRQRIWAYKPWDFLKKTSSLTLSALRTAALPSDFGRMLSVYHDSDNDGRPDWYYYRDDVRTDHRYTITASITLTAQPGWTLLFAKSPDYTPVCLYQMAIEDCTANAHYLFFPRDLVIRAAQLCHVVENKMGAAEIKEIREDFDRLMLDFEQMCQYSNNAQDMRLKDNLGDQIQTEGYTLDGSVGRFVSANDRSYDSE